MGAVFLPTVFLGAAFFTGAFLAAGFLAAVFLGALVIFFVFLAAGLAGEAAGDGVGKTATTTGVVSTAFLGVFVFLATGFLAAGLLVVVFLG